MPKNERKWSLRTHFQRMGGTMGGLWERVRSQTEFDHLLKKFDLLVKSTTARNWSSGTQFDQKVKSTTNWFLTNTQKFDLLVKSTTARNLTIYSKVLPKRSNRRRLGIDHLAHSLTKRSNRLRIDFWPILKSLTFWSNRRRLGIWPFTQKFCLKGQIDYGSELIIWHTVWPKGQIDDDSEFDHLLKSFDLFVKSKTTRI